AANARDDVRIAAVVDTDLAAARRLADEVGAALAVETLAELPGSVEAAIVCSPTSLHAQHALQLIGSGVAVLVEKPLAANVADARRVVRLAEERGVVALSAQVLRYLPLTEVA